MKNRIEFKGFKIVVNFWARSKLTTLAVNTVLPALCRICNQPLKAQDASQGMCAPCKQQLPWNTTACQYCALPMAQNGICADCDQALPRFTHILAPFRYEAPIKQLHRAYKFQQDMTAGALLAQQLAEYCSQQEIQADVIAPVPLHWRRRIRRGFNQSAPLAKAIGQDINIPVQPRLCRRIRPTHAQSQLNQVERRRNIKNAFAVRQDVTGLHILLVDDVCTSGATINELTSTLLRAGAAKVTVAVIARVE